jgi:hypothetical protein
VFVLQSPWAGLLDPSTTVFPVPGTVVAGDGIDVDVDEQADTKTKVVVSATEAIAKDRRRNEGRMRAILRSSRGE